MRSLYFKLILIFLAVSLAGTLLAAYLIRQRNEQAFDRLLREQAEAYIVRDMQAYFSANGTWEGVDRMIHYKFTRSAPGRPPRSPNFALADASGHVIVPAGEWHEHDAVPAGILENGVSVTVDDTTVGTILLLEDTPALATFEERYLLGVNQALVVGALGATAIAVILGAVLARTLTRPLREVAAASNALAAGDLGAQVPVRTQDELGELAAAFNKMSAELARMTRQRRQMTADIAHDLRTPLTVLSGYLEAMEEGTLAPTPARLALMQQEVGGLTRLVEDLRTLSLADAGELTLDVQRTDIGDLLAQVYAAHAPQAERRGVAIELDVAPELPTAEVDRERMRQVLGNLISNALRYTKAGGTVTLGARGDGARNVLMWVRDTGAGIAPEDLPHIFDRFYRADKARAAEEQGESGLGLAIVRSLVEMHGGTITVESTTGQGTAFFIRLPL